jgi:hypothetical protein
MDEKGFQMGQYNGYFCIYDKEIGLPIAPTTGVTKWVTIIGYITANGISLPPFIIHIGKEPENDWFLPNNEFPD